MPLLTFIAPNGTKMDVNAEINYSVMEAAVNNDVPGIDADCRGGCACATCHVYVAPEWIAITGTPGGLEAEMLDMVTDRRETSRLSCQMRISPAFDGLVVYTPATQGAA